MADEGNENINETQLDLIAAKVDGLTSDVAQLKTDVDGVGENVTALVAASDSSSSADIDYSGQLTQLGQALVITDLLLLVLLTVVFLQAGLILGNGVVRWFKHD